jgi:hypothetical protein
MILVREASAMMPVDHRATVVALVVLAFVTLICACDAWKRHGPSDFVDLLVSAPERVKIDGRELALETYIYCDMMPTSPPDSVNLIAGITIVEVDSLRIPSQLDADRLWLIQGREILWETELSSGRPITHPSRLEKVAREGPCCGPGAFVDAVVRVIDRKGRRIYLLRASGQLVGAAY